MKTLLIKVDNQNSADLFISLAKKLKFKTKILTKSEEEKEDAAILAFMEERKSGKRYPVSAAFEILDKI